MARLLIDDRDLQAHFVAGHSTAWDQCHEDKFRGAVPSAAEAYGLSINEVYARPRPLPVLAYIEGYLDALTPAWRITFKSRSTAARR